MTSSLPPDGGHTDTVIVARHVAAGGWRRVVIGLAVGVVAGVLAGLVLPRDDGPRRRDLRAELPFAPGSDPRSGPL